jgi:DNA-binding CsgD family transcriptional regulator/tetratricopeptide (TPR) repeat protein
VLSLGETRFPRPGRMTGFAVSPTPGAGRRSRATPPPAGEIRRNVGGVLHGRDAEQARLSALLEDAAQGRAGTLLVHGEPGVGKSALLENLIQNAAPGIRVLRTQGVESEAPLAFAALHRLLRPVLGSVDRLPAPQSRALQSAFGLVDDATVEPFLVALATLSMLTAAAEEAPVLCVVDDAQWLDEASAEALLVASRRLQADRVAVVFAARDGEGRTFAPDGVPTLALTGLTGPAARALLAEAVGTAMPDQVVDRLMGQASGNPLALIELPTTLNGAQLSGDAPLPAQLPLSAGVERVFLDRCRRLPSHVQTLLLVAAADDSGHVATVRQAAAALGADPASLDAAERSGLLVVDNDTVRVRHPLVRSAVYQAATSRERREAHRALAAALDGATDPDRKAWHQAHAVDAPDEAVVAALQATGERAERRSGYAAAAAAYERAAELTAAERPRAVHLFAAARTSWSAGRTAQARALAAAARDLSDDVVLSADIARLRGRIEVNVGSAVDAHRMFTGACRSVTAQDPARALELAVAAALLSTYGADSGTDLDVTALAVDAASSDTMRTRCLGHLLLSLTQAAGQEWYPALASFRAALSAGADIGDLDVLSHLGNAALHLGDDEAHLRSFTAMTAGAREAGAVMLVLYALPRLGFTQLVTGRWAALRSSAEEALALSVSAGHRPLGAVSLGWLTLLAALQGRPASEYDALLGDLEAATAQPLGVLADPVHDLIRWAQGTRAAHDGDSRTALHHLGSIRLSTLTRLTAVDRIDAAVRAGDPEQAALWVKQLTPFAEGTRWSWALAAVDHGRALLAGPADAPALFESALAHHERARTEGGGRPYDRARTSLAYGEVLRRTQRRVDARTHLRSALETFEDLRAEPLTSRATQELRASGETARKRDPSTLLDFTPMERQVAELVSQGMSNKEIAAQCWVSPRTVAFHLRNIFTKAGITSRGELAHVDLR